MKVELDLWECERIVLALIQVANSVPGVGNFKTMRELHEKELGLALKIDALTRDAK